MKKLRRKNPKKQKYIIIYRDGWEQKIWSMESNKKDAEISIENLIESEGITGNDIECHKIVQHNFMVFTEVSIA